MSDKFIEAMIEFYKNISNHPESFYFTTEGKVNSNFWHKWVAEFLFA